MEKGGSNKRKRSIKYKAKQYGKRGKYNNGEELDEYEYEYFIRIMSVYKDGDEELHSDFVNNVFSEIADNEVKYSSNQLTCRIIEDLLDHSEPEVVQRFVAAYEKDLRIICENQFASHVLEKLLKILCDRKVPEPKEGDASDSGWVFVSKVCRFMLNNIQEYVDHVYANHVARCCLRVLCSLSPPCEESTQLIIAFADRIKLLPNFKDLPWSELGSGLLQILLTSLKTAGCNSELKALLTKLITECFSVRDGAEEGENKAKKQDGEGGELMNRVFKSVPSLMLLESAIEVAPKKKFTQIYAECFINRLPALAMCRGSNLSVQKLLAHCQEVKEFEAIYEELRQQFSGILKAGYYGVFYKLADCCMRFSVKQNDFIHALANCFNCEQGDTGGKLATSIITMSNDSQPAASVTLLGSLTLQAVLQFKKPIRVVNSLLAVEPDQLCTIVCDPRGSHIVDAYISSQYIGEKNKERLANRMRGKYISLAQSKAGSRCFEKLWDVGDLKCKYSIAGELCRSSENGVRIEQGGNLYSRIIASKINLAEYRRDKASWGSRLTKKSDCIKTRHNKTGVE